MRAFRGAPWAVAALVAACGPAVDVEAERAALLEADRAFARATAEEGVEGWVRHFAEDGTMVQPGELVTGRDSIRAAMAPIFSDPASSLTWEPTRADVGSGGDLGYTLGRYELRFSGPEGAVRTSTGTYLTVWRKGPDGAWKVVLDQGTPDPEAAP